MNELIISVGLFFVLEGIVYALFPNGVKRMAEELPNIPTETLRTFGLGAMIFGLLIVWMFFPI
ncbi:MAG: DUF2065 domain-containing protein [Nitratireductor sp.]